MRSVADFLMPFVFEGSDVRGAVVDLDDSWREVLKRHDYPLPVRSLLGEAMAAAALLSSTLKFDGTLVLQTQAEDRTAPVRLLVVECNADLSMRATAKLGGTPFQETQAHSLANLVGNGKLVITLDPRTKDDDREDGNATAYQGVVPLEGEHLAGALENYMLRSEQLDTRIFLAADENRAAGLLIQRMPSDGGKVLAVAESRWPDAEALASTIRSQELLTLEPREVVRRLFHEFDLRVFRDRPTRFACSCSRERVAGMLRMLGAEEVESILAEQGAVSVNCEFCNQAYAFDPIDAAQLFVPPAPESGARH